MTHDDDDDDDDMMMMMTSSATRSMTIEYGFPIFPGILRETHWPRCTRKQCLDLVISFPTSQRHHISLSYYCGAYDVLQYAVAVIVGDSQVPRD